MSKPEKEAHLSNSFNNNILPPKATLADSNKRKRIFNIFKKNKLTNSEHEIDHSFQSDNDCEFDDLISKCENGEKRVSANSKVYFSKLFLL